MKDNDGYEAWSDEHWGPPMVEDNRTQEEIDREWHTAWILFLLPFVIMFLVIVLR